MLRCVAQKHTGITGNEHLSPAKSCMARSGTRHSSHSQSRNRFAVASSVGSKLRRGAIRATQDRDSCAVAHRRYILLSSPYIQSIPNFLQWVKIGWNILKLLISIDIYWYLLMSKYEGAPQLVVCSGSRLDHFASCYSDTSRKQDERLRFVQRLSSFSIWRVNYPKLWG